MLGGLYAFIAINELSANNYKHNVGPSSFLLVEPPDRLHRTVIAYGTTELSACIRKKM